MIRKVRLVSKFMTSQPGKQTVSVDIFPNTSRSKRNQTSKFSLLTECNMINIFLSKSCTKCGGESTSRHFSKKSKLSRSLDQCSKVLCSFIFLTSWDILGYQNISKLSYRLLTFKQYKAFLKNKEVLCSSPHLIFYVIFKEKYFSSYILL